MAHLYKNGRNYHVQLYVGGKRRRFSLKTDNYGIARDMVRKYEADLIGGNIERATTTPLSDLAERFAQFLHANARPGASAVQTDLYRLREFLGPVCARLQRNRRVRRSRQAVCDGDPPYKRTRKRKRPRKEYSFACGAEFAEEITPGMIADFLTRIRNERKLSPKTVNEYREIIHRFMNWAIHIQGVRMRGGLKTNPCTGVPKLKQPLPVIRFLEIEQIHKQLDVLETHPTLLALVATYIYAGLRREEALWLTNRDVDLKRRLIHVRAKAVGHEQWWPKTGRNRSVPISSTLHHYLSGYEPPRNEIWYFPSPRGCRWDADNFSHHLAAVNREHGLQWTCLDFRHTVWQPSGNAWRVAVQDLGVDGQFPGGVPAPLRRSVT